MEQDRPVSRDLEIQPKEESDEEVRSRLKGVLSPAMTGNAMGKILATKQTVSTLLRTCDFDVAGGPLEMDEAEWDGVSVWIGDIPNHGVCRRDGKGDGAVSPTAASARASTDIFLKLYTLTDNLEQALNAFGEGIEPDDTGLRTVCMHATHSWALVTFKRREDAEAMLDHGLAIATGSELDGARASLLLKRAICAAEAKQQLEEAAQVAKQRHEMVILAINRIQGWVKRSGKQLVDLFAKIDVDGSGTFNVQEFRAGMLSIGLTFTDEVIDALMQEMDKDGDGEVDAAEFIAKMDKFTHEMNTSASSILGALLNYIDASGATVASIFAAHDNDKSGNLEIAEFHDALLAIGIQQSEQQAQNAMGELDMDKDGNMSLAELTARLSTYRRKRRAFASKVLSDIFEFIRKTNASATRIFSRVDSDGSGDLDVLEFQEALSKMGQELTPDQVHEIMSELDLDQSGTIGVSEFLDKLKHAENLRRSDMRKCKKLFEEADKDGSGTLDYDEIVWVGREMGLGEQMKSQEFVEHMLAEMHAGDMLKDHDVKADGSISPKFPESREEVTGESRPQNTRAAFMTSLTKTTSIKSAVHVTTATNRIARAPTGANASKTHELSEMSFEEAGRTVHVGGIKSGGELENEDALTQLFEESGDVASVTLRKKEGKKSWALVTFAHREDVRLLLQALASGDGLAYDLMIKKHQLRVVQLDYEKQANSTGGMLDVAHQHKIKLGYTQFIAWFLEIGRSYLDKPKYEAQPVLVVPPEEELQALFQRVDADNSGEADLVEVQEEMHLLWPYLDSTGFHRAFQAADTDHSGHIDYSEFKNLVNFIIWLSEQRHSVQELHDAFGTHVTEDEFYFGCQCLKISVTDGKARYLFQAQCQAIAVSKNEQAVSEIDFDRFIIWAVRYSCVNLKFGEPPETDAQRHARQCAEMSKELENLAGEYGDIHFMDLVTVVSRKRATSPGLSGGDGKKSKWKMAMKRATTSVLECSELVKKGIEFSTKQNDSFPNFNDEALRAMVRMCTKEEYFAGQNIITEGEVDSRYYVLRRGRVDVIISDPSKRDECGEPLEVKVASMDWGMGFGEIGLLLATKRTATIRATTPCEVFCLDRAGYETVLALLPEDQRLGPMAKAMNDFWKLMTGPDGSRRECVDFKTYLKSHVRTSKTLMTNSDMDEFDEAEERAVAQSDWEEDCARYHMKVTGSLNKVQYFDAMYQLVYLWSEDQQLSYATFLTWIFENIAEWNEEQNAFMFRKVEQVQCVGDKFEKMKEDARDIEAAKAEAAAEVLAAAEAARAAHAAQIEEERKLLAEENRLEEENLVVSGKLGALATAEANLQKQLVSLKNEEAELLRRLQSGELSPAEEAVVRARLAEIEQQRETLQAKMDAIQAERAELKAKLQANQHNLHLRELDKKLSKLEAEETELRRRLASGKLSPAEESTIRARLAEIAGEKATVLANIEHARLGLAQAEADGLVAQLASEIQQVDNQLVALANEEAELMRRLASGELTPEQEAEVRARLNAIAEQRHELMEQRQRKLLAKQKAKAEAIKHTLGGELMALDNRLSALDDEEAELLRRLQNGDLTPEEEEAVRARLNEITSERATLQARKEQHSLAAELEQLASALSVLDDEEALLKQRLARGDLTPEEEKKVRERLAAIDSERHQLKQRRIEVYKAETDVLQKLAASGGLSPEEFQKVGSRLAAVDALLSMEQEHEEAGSAPTDACTLASPFPEFSSMSPQEIHRWKAELDLRRARELAEANRLARVSTPNLTTAPPQWGCGAHALATAAEARHEWSTYAVTKACRDQQWVELDASRLPPKLLAEWQQLRSTLRKSDRAGRGRALAWLSKALRQLDIIENQEATLNADNINRSDDMSSSTQSRESINRRMSCSKFPAPFVPRSSLVKSPRQRQRQRQRDTGMTADLSANGLFGSVSSPQLGLDPASGTFFSSYQVAGHRTSPTLPDEQELMQLQLGLPRGDSVADGRMSPELRSASPGSDSRRSPVATRGVQLGAGQFDMEDKQCGGAFRVFSASYTELGVGAVPTSLLRGPYMEWEAPDSPYRTQVRMVNAQEKQRTEPETTASPTSRSVTESADTKSDTNVPGEKKTSKRDSPTTLNHRTGRDTMLPALTSAAAMQDWHDSPTRRKFTHLPSATSAAATLPLPSDFDLPGPFVGLDMAAAFDSNLNMVRHNKQKYRHRQASSRYLGSSGFSFEGSRRRSPVRPTHNLHWDGPIGTIARF